MAFEKLIMLFAVVDAVDVFICRGTATFGDRLSVPWNLNCKGRTSFLHDAYVGHDLNVDAPVIAKDRLHVGDDIHASGPIVMGNDCYCGDDLKTERSLVAGDRLEVYDNVEVGGNVKLGFDVKIGDDLMVDRNLECKDGLYVTDDISCGKILKLGWRSEVGEHVFAGGFITAKGGLKVGEDVFAEKSIDLGINPQVEGTINAWVSDVTDSTVTGTDEWDPFEFYFYDGVLDPCDDVTFKNNPDVTVKGQDGEVALDQEYYGNVVLDNQATVIMPKTTTIKRLTVKHGVTIKMMEGEDLFIQRLVGSVGNDFQVQAVFL